MEGEQILNYAVCKMFNFSLGIRFCVFFSQNLETTLNKFKQCLAYSA